MKKEIQQVVEEQKYSVDEMSIAERFDILVEQLSNEPLSVEEAAVYKQRLNEVLMKAVNNNGNSFTQEFPTINTLSTNENYYKTDNIFSEGNTKSKRTIVVEVLKKVTTLLIAISLITLGFSMIILPAPPYFEMFTVFYFTDDDGVTIMDLISLIIILCGVYIFISTLVKHRKIKA